MALIWIDNIGALGLGADGPERDLPPEVWTRVENVRFEKGIAKPFPGEGAGLPTPPVPSAFALPFKQGLSNEWLILGDEVMYRTSGEFLQDVTPEGGFSSPGGRWTGTNLNGAVVVNAADGRGTPWALVGTGRPKMAPLPNWPEGMRAKAVRGFKNFFLALNLTREDFRYSIPYGITWSHPADPGTVPVSWDISDPATLAGEMPLGDTPGVVLDSHPLGDLNIIAKEDSLVGMQFIGGNQIFRFWTIFNDFGALSQNCMVNTPKGQVVVGRGDIILHNGTSRQSIATERLLTWFWDTINDAEFARTHVTANREFREVWVNFVSKDSVGGRCDKALVWNWERNTWTTRDLPGVNFIASGIVPELGYAPVVDDVSTIVDEFHTPFDATFYPQMTDGMLLIGDELQRGDVAGTVSGPGVLERTGLGIVGRDRHGSWKVDHEAVKFIRNLYPKITAPVGTEFNFYLGKQLDQGGDIEWVGPFSFRAGIDTRVNCIQTTKVINIRVETGSNTEWQFHGYGIDLHVKSRY